MEITITAVVEINLVMITILGKTMNYMTEIAAEITVKSGATPAASRSQGLEIVPDSEIETDIEIAAEINIETDIEIAAGMRHRDRHRDRSRDETSRQTSRSQQR